MEPAEEQAIISEFTDKTLKVVVVDGVVVLKIMKHCKDNLPETVTGQLVGLDSGNTLQVTNSIPLPQLVQLSLFSLLQQTFLLFINILKPKPPFQP